MNYYGKLYAAGNGMYTVDKNQFIGECFKRDGLTGAEWAQHFVDLHNKALKDKSEEPVKPTSPPV